MIASRWPILRDGIHRYELRLRELSLGGGNEPAGQVVQFFDEHHAQTFFRKLMSDAANLSILRGFLACDLTSLSFLSLRETSEHRIAQVLAWSVARGDLRVLRYRVPVPKVLFAKEPEIAPPPTAKPASTSWVEVRVAWDETGEAVVDLPLVVEVPGGRSEMRSTRHDGTIRLEPVDSGVCEARCSFAGLSQAECAVFVGIGEGERQPGADSGKKAESKPKAIVQVISRKVRTGETLESIAREAALKSQDLAYFNWGTRVPEEINRHLAEDVGCTNKSSDGKSYVFNDSDSPGVILVPRQWRQPGLEAGRQHIVRVRPLAHLMLVLENEEGLRLPEVGYRVLFDGKAPALTGTLGLNGTALLPAAAEGGFEVVYPDQDDVLAKSLAANLRKALDDGETGPIFRLFAHDRVVVKRAIQAYDTYFNTYTGGGVLEDLRQVLTDAEALLSCERLLALHGIESQPRMERTSAQRPERGMAS